MNSGHLVPMNVPKQAFDLAKRFVYGLSFDDERAADIPFASKADERAWRKTQAAFVASHSTQPRYEYEDENKAEHERDDVRPVAESPPVKFVQQQQQSKLAAVSVVATQTTATHWFLTFALGVLCGIVALFAVQKLMARFQSGSSSSRSGYSEVPDGGSMAF
jgi:hypothetical protein